MRKRQFRVHQKKAFYFSLGRKHTALFMEMRLGKTLVAIRTVCTYKPLNPPFLRVLVVAPNSALYSWESELTQEGKTFKRLQGTREKRLELLNDRDVEFYLLNKEGFLVIPEIANNSQNWDAVILDESTFIKNPRTKVSKFFSNKFRDVPHRMILTGTPNPESELDFYCQFQFLKGNLLGCRNFWVFRNTHFSEGMFFGQWTIKSESIKKLYKEIAEHSVIMQRKDVGAFDDKITENRYCELSGYNREVYRKAEKDFILECEDGTKSTHWILTKYHWLRQICGGFIDGKLSNYSKLQELQSLLFSELVHDKVVVWFSYNHEIYEAFTWLSQGVLGDILIMDGSSSPRERGEILEKFKKESSQVLLIQQAVAQYGMDLSVSDTSIYYSEPLGLLARKQTEDRILSLEKKCPILLVNLIVKNTIDEDIRLAMLNKSIRSNLSLTRIIQQSIKNRIQE